MASVDETDDGPSDESLVRGYTGRMLGVIALGSMSIMSGRLVLSPLLPRVIEDLAISPSRAGLALSVMWLLVAWAQYPGGQLSDRLSRKTIMVAGLGLATVGAALFAISTAYPVFVLGALVFGLGAGLYPSAALAQLSDLFERRRGRALGVNAASFNFGGVIAAGLATATVSLSLVWRAAFIPVIIAFALVALSLHRLSREAYVLESVGFQVRETAGRLVAIPQVRWLLLAAGASGIMWQGAANFLPTFLQVEKGLPGPLANNVFAGLFIVAGIATPIAGNFGDRFGYLAVAAGTSALGLGGLALLVVGGSVGSIAVGVVTFAAALGGFWPVINAHVMSVVPRSSRGGDFGAFRSLSITVASLGPAYVGVVAEQLSYTIAFASLAACPLIAGAITLRLSLAQRNG